MSYISLIPSHLKRRHACLDTNNKIVTTWEVIESTSKEKRMKSLSMAEPFWNEERAQSSNSFFYQLEQIIAMDFSLSLSSFPFNWVKISEGYCHCERSNIAWRNKVEWLNSCEYSPDDISYLFYILTFKGWEIFRFFTFNGFWNFEFYLNYFKAFLGAKLTKIYSKFFICDF